MAAIRYKKLSRLAHETLGEELGLRRKREFVAPHSDFRRDSVMRHSCPDSIAPAHSVVMARRKGALRVRRERNVTPSMGTPGRGFTQRK